MKKCVKKISEDNDQSSTSLWLTILAGLACSFLLVNASNHNSSDSNVTERRRQVLERSLILWQRDAPLLSATIMGALRFGKVRATRSLALILAALAWKVVCLRVWDYTGVIKALFGMDLVKGMECYFYDGEEYIAFLLQMDAPESLEKFRGRMQEHFFRFPKF